MGSWSSVCIEPQAPVGAGDEHNAMTTSTVERRDASSEERFIIGMRMHAHERWPKRHSKRLGGGELNHANEQKDARNQ